MMVWYSVLNRMFRSLLPKLRKLGEREIKETMKDEKIRRRDAISRLWHSHYKQDLTAGEVASV